MYKHVDYYKTYGRIMQFNKNKKEPIHRWYPFVEGYSREFIREFDSCIIKIVRAGRIKPVLFLSSFSLYYLVIFSDM